MFSRYVSPDQASIEREFDLVRSAWEFSDNFNVAPMGPVPVIRVVDERPDPVLLNWGFGEPVTYQVPAEAMHDNRGVLAHGQRCILPALGFYAFRVSAERGRQPFYVHLEDQEVFGFPGFWQHESCVVITLPANELMAEIGGAGTRMPAILAREMRDVWLYGSVASAADALCAYSADLMVAYPVSPRVSSLDNNDETLIEPLEIDVD
jgi:putative SOS response-associated peptidase YedK